ncbi:hypothetical protein VPH35_039317 [Triticum aestivum]|uniref:F-box domain-containing protein n=1 Tax=Aegilops tauschii TaxID=37682 RepID=M8BWI3_AEGTA
MAGARAEDVLREVFARLPGVEDLLRCAVTCRRWRRLAIDRAFLRRIGLWPDSTRRPTMLAGIFSQNMFPDRNRVQPLKREPRSPPQFLSLHAGGAHLNFTSFVADDDGLFNNARPLVSRRGFLLLRVILPADTGGREKLHLAVCRPLIDKRDTHLLPPPPIDPHKISDRGLTGCAILTSADHAVVRNLDWQDESAFQVLLTYTDEHGLMNVYMYCSTKQSWSSPVTCRLAPKLTRCGPRAGIVTHGFAHWLYKNETCFYFLNVSAVRTRVSSTKITRKVHAGMSRKRPPLPCVAGEGRISLVNIRDHVVLELWAKQERKNNDHQSDSERGWLHSKLTDLGSTRINLVFFAESRGALLIEQGGAFFTVDLKSKEKVRVNLKRDETHRRMRWFPADYCSSSFCGGHRNDGTCEETPPVLYEMDCVFSHRIFLNSSVDEARVD